MLKSAIYQQYRTFGSTSARNAFAKMNILGTIGSVIPKETKDGIPFLTYSLAVNRYSPSGVDNRVTDWFNVSVFNERHVGFFNTYIKPGAQIYVECDVRQKQYVDENGETKYMTALRQLDYDVVRFAKRSEEEVEGEE